MRSIDILAIGCAVLSLLSFVSSSNSYQIGRTALGTLKLLMGVVALFAAIGAGVASIGTDGYRPLRPQPSDVATVSVEGLPGDSLSARVTWPSGVTRTFRLSGRRVRFDVRTLRWKIGGELFGATRSWELSGLAAERADGSIAPGSDRDLQATRPITVYDVVIGYPALTALVATDRRSVVVPIGASEVPLRISTDALVAGN